MRSLMKRITIYLLLCLALVGCGQDKSFVSNFNDENTIDLNKLQINNLMTLAGESKKFNIKEIELPSLPKDYKLKETVANEKFIYGIMLKEGEKDTSYYLLQYNRKTERSRYLIFYSDSERPKEVAHLEMSALGPVFSSIGDDKSTIHLLNERRGKFEKIHQQNSATELAISSDDKYISYIDMSKAHKLWLLDLEEKEPQLLSAELNVSAGLPYIEGNYIFYASDERFHIRNRISGEELNLKILPFEEMDKPQGNDGYLMAVLQNEDAPKLLVYPLKTATPELYQSKDMPNIVSSMPTANSILIETEEGIFIVDQMNYTIQKLYGFYQEDRIIDRKKNHLGNYQILMELPEGDLKFVEFTETSVME